MWPDLPDAAFPFKTDQESEAFCWSIAREMTRLFGISEHEAIRRICRFWGHITEIVGEDIIYHEDEDYWARTIYYGKDSSWWIADRAAKDLPPLKPLPLD